MAPKAKPRPKVRTPEEASRGLTYTGPPDGTAGKVAPAAAVAGVPVRGSVGLQKRGGPKSCLDPGPAAQPPASGPSSGAAASQEGPATEEASGSGHRPAEEEDGELPRLPLDAFHFLLPRFLVLFGDGNPKGYFLKLLGNDFLKWFRAVVPEYHDYRNAWPTGQMRRFCEECPGTEVLDIPLEGGGSDVIVRLLRGNKTEWLSDDLPLPSRSA